MTYPETPSTDFGQRDPLPKVNELFYKRWSPRAFRKTKVDPQDVDIIFEAARWSPSCFNEQPWHFYISTEHSFEQFLGLLVETNQAWAKNASVLGFIVARKQFAKNDKDNAHARFDCGAAWMAMSLQARMLGLYTHGMAGIKYDDVYEELDIDSNTHDVVAGFAIGVIDSPEALPENFRNKEIPSERKALSSILVKK